MRRVQVAPVCPVQAAHFQDQLLQWEILCDSLQCSKCTLPYNQNPTQNSINNHVQQPYSASQDMHESCSHASPRIPYDIEQQIQIQAPA